jgi:hypothetical protein
MGRANGGRHCERAFQLPQTTALEPGLPAAGARPARQNRSVRITCDPVCIYRAGGRCTTPDEPRPSDIDLWGREITVHGKGRKTRTVKIGPDAARALDRYIRIRARHAQAYRLRLDPATAAR